MAVARCPLGTDVAFDRPPDFAHGKPGHLPATARLPRYGSSCPAQISSRITRPPPIGEHAVGSPCLHDSAQSGSIQPAYETPGNSSCAHPKLLVRTETAHRTRCICGEILTRPSRSGQMPAFHRAELVKEHHFSPKKERRR